MAMMLSPSVRRCWCCSPITVMIAVLVASTPSAVAGFHTGSRWRHPPSTVNPCGLGPAVFIATPARQQYPRHHPTTTKSTTRQTHGTVLHSALATAVDTFFQSYPYAAAALTCGVKASTADWVAQKRSYRKRNESVTLSSSNRVEPKTPLSSPPSEPSSAQGGASGVAVAVPSAAAAASSSTTDLKRNVAYLLYGAIYQGMAQEFIYNHLYPVMFGSGSSWTIVVSKVLFDLLVQTTLVTLPIAYLTKALIYNYSAREALRRYWDDILNHGLLKKYFLLWGPVQCLTFSIVPEHYRVAFIACVSFFWIIILSTIASRTSVPVKKVTPKPETAVVAAAVVVEGEPITIVMEDMEEEEDIPECAFVDGLTCNVDG